MAEQWNASNEVYQLVRDLVKDHHSHLFHVLDGIAVIFKEKASKSGGQVQLGKSKKAPQLLGVLSSIDYKFILEIAGDEWQKLTDTQKKALLDHLLCYCRCEEIDETGDMKYFLASPEVSFFYEELDRNGDWRPRPDATKAFSLLDMLRNQDAPESDN